MALCGNCSWKKVHLVQRINLNYCVQFLITFDAQSKSFRVIVRLNLKCYVFLNLCDEMYINQAHNEGNKSCTSNKFAHVFHALISILLKVELSVDARQLVELMRWHQDIKHVFTTDFGSRERSEQTHCQQF
jgi:hypothetical protein